jgi:DNA-binding NarL/FixJ family response regulator
LRKGFVFVLSSEPDLEVIGEAADGLEALELCQRLRPDLVLMDVSMPKMDGIDATKAMKECCPKTVVLVVTAHDDEGLMVKAIKAGAAGYVLKGSQPAYLIRSVREALEGESPMDPGLAGRLLRRLAIEGVSPDERPQPVAERESPLASPAVSLPPRELEVLEHLVAGKTNRLIAKELHISLSTVKRYLERITSKLGVSDRTQAAVKAIELGLLPERREG